MHKKTIYLRLLETTMSQKNILRVQYSIFACSYKNSEKVKDDEKNCMQTFKSQVLVNRTVSIQDTLHTDIGIVLTCKLYYKNTNT